MKGTFKKGDKIVVKGREDKIYANILDDPSINGMFISTFILDKILQRQAEKGYLTIRQILGKPSYSFKFEETIFAAHESQMDSYSPNNIRCSKFINILLKNDKTI